MKVVDSAMHLQYARAMRDRRESFIPLTRVFDRERKIVEDEARAAGYTLADFVRASLGLEPEHLPKDPNPKVWSTSTAGTLRYNGKTWTGDIVELLNERCVFPNEVYRFSRCEQDNDAK